MLVTAIWLGLAVTLWLWWHQTSASQVTDGPSLLTAAGRLAGLTGGYLLLAQVLLMSRVPLIASATSGARLSRWHRDLGAYVVLVIGLHAVFITLGYAGAAKVGALHEVWQILTTYQDMISATVAFGIMVTIAVLAIRGIRRRLPYGLWHGLHSTVYLVLLFAYGHQFANGQQFVLSHPAHLYWTVLYLVVVAALIYGRLVVPLILNLRHDLRVHTVIAEASDVVSIYLAGRHLERLHASAGQFVRVRFVTRDGWWRSHPFSLSAAPNPAWLRVTVKAVGDYSGQLAHLPPGTRVIIDAPAGEFTADRQVGTGALLIAAGTGITPIRALMESLPAGTTVLYRARTPEELIFKAELDRLAKGRRIRVRYVIGSRTDPEPAEMFTAEGLGQLVPDVTGRDVYVCGPPGFGEMVSALLAALEVPERQIHLDMFEL